MSLRLPAQAMRKDSFRQACEGRKGNSAGAVKDNSARAGKAILRGQKRQFCGAVKDNSAGAEKTILRRTGRIIPQGQESRLMTQECNHKKEIREVRREYGSD